ncbi:MAG: FxsA family protein [Planctomycetes bacterium]|nr:FxsA family protein [Planctomycetota bacterium]
MFFWLFALFTLVPIVELSLLIQIGGRLGVLPTLALVFGTGALGAWMARRQGLRALHAVQADLTAGRMPAESLLDGILILLGAVLLITPGVLTDALGLALLVPPVRQVFRVFLRAWAAQRIHVVTFGPGGSPSGRATPRATPTPHTILEAEVIRPPEPPRDAVPRDPPVPGA